MRHGLMLFLVACICICVDAAPTKRYLSSSEEYFSVDNLKLSFVATPLVRYGNINNTNVTSTRNRWAVLESSFVPLQLKNSKNLWYDDVTMEGMLVISSEDAKGARQFVVLNGKTRFFTIPADGKIHYGMFFAPPRILDRYYVYGKAFHVSMFKAARISFYGPGRVLLGEGYWIDGSFVKKPKEQAKAKAFLEQFEKKYSDVIQLRGGLYSKEKTPWANFNYDQYDLIYDDTVGDAPGQDIVK